MSSELTDDEKAMRARIDAATCEPWEVIESRDVFPAVICPGVLTICTDFERDSDARFVAAARTDLPKCLDEIQRQSAELAEMRRELASVRRQYLIMKAGCDLPPEQSTLSAELVQEVRRNLEDVAFDLREAYSMSPYANRIDAILSKLSPAQKEEV